MFFIDFIRQGFGSNSKSASEFAKVKAGLNSGAENIPIDFVWLLLIAIIAIMATSALIAIVQYKRRKKTGAWFSISDAGRIAAVFKRAVARNASFTLEVFSPHHTGLYRGKVVDVKEGAMVILELSQSPKIDTDFDGIPSQVHINFRPAPKSEMEHYQFSTKTLSLDFVKEGGWRSAKVIVSWPRNIISAQRRDFLRLEPLGKHALYGRFYHIPEEPITSMCNEQEEIVCGAVLDISLGGAQLSFNGIVALNETQRFICLIDLPVENLSVEVNDTKLYILVQMMTQDIIGTSYDRNSSDGEKSGTKTIVRVKFLGRYQFNQQSNLWSYSSFNLDSMQDLSHWMYAYQRFELQKEKGLLPSPDERKNIYPSVELKRPGTEKNENNETKKP